MIPFPFQAGQLGFTRPGVDPQVTLRQAGSMVIQAASTTVAPAVPVGALAGGLLVAVIMRRSAVASDPPSGWALISSSGPANDGGATSQWTHVYSKTATGLEAGGTVTFAQASSGRIIGQIFELAGNTNTPLLESQNTVLQNGVVTNTLSLSSVSAAGNGRLGIAVGSFISATGSPVATDISADSGWTIISPPSIDQNRVGIFYKALSSGANTTGTVTSTITPTTTGTTSHSLIFASP